MPDTSRPSQTRARAALLPVPKAAAVALLLAAAAAMTAVVSTVASTSAGAEGAPTAEVLFRFHATPDSPAVIVDREMLDRLDRHGFATTTVWTDGELQFSGVTLARFLQAMEAEGAAVRISALDGYEVVVPFAEISDSAPLLATRIDGAVISRRERGPVWLVYPYDYAPQYRSETILARSIWQIERMTVLPELAP